MDSKGGLGEVAAPGLLDTRVCLCLAARRAARRITRRFDGALRPHGLRSTQFSALAVLALAGEQSVGELAARLDADRTTMSRNVALLHERGWVQMSRGGDGRERIVSLAQSGRQRLTEALPAWRRTQAEISGQMGADGAAHLVALAWSEGASGSHEDHREAGHEDGE